MANQPEETSLIQTYLAPLAAPAGLGLSDDAASLSPTPGMDLVITTDTIVENVHFLPTDTPFDIAIKAITVNLSDLVAKGAKPVGYQIALSLPEKPDAEWMAQFAPGLREQIEGQLLGGDITVSKGGPLTLSVTAIGEVPTGKMVQRSGTNIGDQIFVCGPIGTKFVGLKCATDTGFADKSGLSKDEAKRLVTQYAAPRVGSSERVAEIVQSYASASLDISDGLVIDLQRLCAASGVGAAIEAEAIPLDAVVHKLLTQSTVSLVDLITGGDDYVALFTASKEASKAIKNSDAAICHRIGEIVAAEKGVRFAMSNGVELSLDGRSGYDHFSTKN